MKKIYSIITTLSIAIAAGAQAPVFVSVTPNTATPSRLEKFELTVSLTAAFTNAYDYDDIALQAFITAPSGKKDTVDGFYMQDYTLNTTNGNVTPVGSGIFKVRYTPVETGAYSYVLTCTNLAGTTTQATSATFQSGAATGKGFIRKNTTNYLNFDNGEQYIPIGENLAWHQSNRYTDFKTWTQKLFDNKANLIRVWLAHWSMGLEWKDNYDGFLGLRKYKQSNAYYLDWLIDECKAKGLYVMLCINHHGQVSTTTDPNWGDSPYNSANGGPIDSTYKFFTDASARATHKNRLRYIVARWGYSPNIESWELFNEVKWTNNYVNIRPQVRDWHNEMAIYLKGKDPMKHLVTTSSGDDLSDSLLWRLPSLDFTQSHFYSGSGNIETVLNGGIQGYLSAYNKPTVNGEFGINPPGGINGASISAADSSGNNVHNSMWATAFNGAMGPAMPWFWNDYIDPKNLYYHFKPLATVLAGIPLKDANYKRTTATIASSIVSDVAVSPGSGYGLAPAGSFTVNSDGTLTPGANQLSSYLFGSTFNLQNRRPPTFTVNYPVTGQFIVRTGSSVNGSTMQPPSTITIYVDGVQQLSQTGAINTSYPVPITAGPHTIKVDNLGTDWITIANYTFTNIGSPINTYLLKSADSLRTAGWLHNKNYNWLYLRNNNQTPPPPVTDGVIQIAGMKNGMYTVAFYNCITGLQTGSISTTAVNNTLSFALPTIAWDLAFTATSNSIVPITLNSFTGRTTGNTNQLFIDIATSQNVRTVSIERSNDGFNFTTISQASKNWSSIAGKHNYTDANPGKGDNFYRLKITDKDGSVTWSGIVKLSNTKPAISVYPNPFTSYLVLTTDAGKYVAQVTDASGRIVSQKTLVAVGSQSTLYTLPVVTKGTYYLVVRDAQKKTVYQETLVK